MCVSRTSIRAYLPHRVFIVGKQTYPGSFDRFAIVVLLEKSVQDIILEILSAKRTQVAEQGDAHVYHF